MAARSNHHKARLIKDNSHRLPKACSRDTSSATLKGHRKTKIQPNSISFRQNASNNKWVRVSEETIGE